MSRESRIVSPSSFHSVYIHVSPFYFRIGLQMQKRRTPFSENENLCSSAAPIFPLPSSPFPSQPIVSRLDLDAKYSSTFRSGEWKKKFKNAIRYFFFIRTFCYIYIYFFFRVYSKSYLRGI